MTRRQFLTALSLIFSLSLSACIHSPKSLGRLPDEAACMIVAPFDVRYDSSGSTEIVSEYLALDLFRQGFRGVLGPQDLRKMFIDSKRDLPPSMDHFWAQKIGKELGVDSVIIGSVAQIPWIDRRKQEVRLQFDIEAYLIDIASGGIRWSYGTREVIFTDDYLEKMSVFTEEMAKTLLLGRNAAPDTAKSGCWGTLKSGELAKEAEKAIAPLSPAQKLLMAQFRSSEELLWNSTYFEGRTDILAKKALPILHDMAVVFSQKDLSSRILIEAHIDSTADSAGDLELSKKRAMVIKTYLESLGVSSEKIEAVGHGGNQPKVPNMNAKSRLLNQRVIFKALPIEAS